MKQQLLFLGFVLFFKKVKINEDGSQMIAMSKRDYVKTFFSGYFMNTLNPGVIGFWLVIATSVVDLSRGYRIIMFSTCLLFCEIENRIEASPQPPLRWRGTRSI